MDRILLGFGAVWGMSYETDLTTSILPIFGAQILPKLAYLFNTDAPPQHPSAAPVLGGLFLFSYLGPRAFQC